ncbi:MAG: trigger factor [Pseudomonadota bacterium]
MSESVERVDPTTIKVNIDIKWSDFKKDYVTSIRKIGKDVRIKGFRAGKAPLSILEKLLGKDVKMETAVETVTSRIKEVMEKEKIYPIREDYKVRENVIIEDNKEVRFSKEVEVLPELAAIDFKGIELEKEAPVSQEEVEREAQKLAARKAPVSNRPDGERSEEYDIVILSGKVEFEEEGLGPVELKDERIDLAPWSNLPEDVTRVCLGKKAGDAINEKVHFPIGGNTPQLRPATMKCSVQSVLHRQIPPLDDELARDYDFKTMKELKDDIRRQLEEDAHRRWTDMSADAALTALTEKSNVPLPRSYRDMVEEKMSGAPGDGSEEEKKKLRAESEREFKKFVLCQVLAQQNGLRISQEELHNNLEAMSGVLQRMKMDEAKRREFLKNWLREYETAQFFKLINNFVVNKVMEGAGGGDEKPEEPSGREESKEAKATGETASNKKEP